MLKRLTEQTVNFTDITDTTYSQAFDMNYSATLSVQSQIDENTDSAKTFDTGTFETQTLTFPNANEINTFTLPSLAASTGGDYGTVTTSAGVSWAFALNKSGADPAPTGAIYAAIAAGRKVNVDISAATTAAQVAALVKTGVEALTSWASFFTVTDPANGTLVFTHVLRGAAANGGVHNANDSGAGSITVAQTRSTAMLSGDYIVWYQNGADFVQTPYALYCDLTGSDVAPTGAIYTAIAAAHKGSVNLSAATTSTTVATAFETAADLLTGMVVTTTPSTNTILLTQIVPGPTTNPVPKNADDSGAGSITGVETTPGVATEVNPAANTVTIPSHGLPTGLKGRLTTTGTLPAGLSLATDYFIIVVDANTVKFATSLANAEAGTAVDITGYGATTSVNTFTPTALSSATIYYQRSNVVVDGAASTDAADWDNIDDATDITVDADVWFTKIGPEYRWFRIGMGLGAGSISAVHYVIIRGEDQ